MSIDNIIDNIETLFLKEDIDIIEVILSNKGTIFGGYLRDCCSNTIANDIDAVISDIYKDSFLSQITKIYKTYTCDGKYEPYIFTAPNRRNLEVIFDEDDPDEIMLGPCPSPDFDINTLSYCRKFGLSTWTGEGDIHTIIRNILNKTCVQLSPDKEISNRIIKILDKGFNITDKSFI